MCIVKEKEPVARVFSSAGNSFYIDSVGKRMPLPEKLECACSRIYRVS